MIGETLGPLVQSSILDKLRDPKTGQYCELEMLGEPPWKRIATQLGIDEDQNPSGPELKIAVIDTGMMLDHPSIKPHLLKSIDYTNEGAEDLNGHGTLVTLLIVSQWAPWVPYRLLNVKALGRNGHGSEESIIKGIKWAVEERVHSVHLSVGVPREKLGMAECKGDCELCRVAEDATREGVAVIAAAGNTPGQTCCPAKVGLIRRNTVIASGALDPETGKIAHYSGTGNFYAPEPRYRLKPVC